MTRDHDLAKPGGDLISGGGRDPCDHDPAKFGYSMIRLWFVGGYIFVILLHNTEDKRTRYRYCSMYLCVMYSDHRRYSEYWYLVPNNCTVPNAELDQGMKV